MTTFEKNVINDTVDKLIRGEDYREEVINAINVRFFDFTLIFFKEILNAKLNNTDVTLDWYKEKFINNGEVSTEDRVINAGLNKKTVSNIYGSASRDIMLNAAETNYEYLSSLISELEGDLESEIDISIKICYGDISVDLTLSESLLVINALANKKLAIRGGAWSSIGKKVEKPLINKLCEITKVPSANIDNSIFVKNREAEYDREVDYKLISSLGKIYRVEVKLMGKGNPESADAIIARDSDVFVADTLSEQNKRQCDALNVKWLELKNNPNVISDFKKILDELDVPHQI